MASSAKYISLNLGMQTLSMSEYHSQPNGGLSLHAFRQVELIADPGADATRTEQIKLAVQQLAGEMNLKRETVNYVLPSQAVFTRFVKLPASTSEQLEQVIRFEAQQNVPFPIDEVVWDYQAIGEPQDGKQDVVLVAIKADILGQINDAVTASGLKPGVIDVAPMALYNAFRYNYPDASGCSMLIDIGARTTNLIFIERDRVFSRSIPVGGSTITAAVSKEFHQDFPTSEQLKIAKGFVGLGGSYAEPDDPNIARLSKLIRNSLTRLHAEIARSISFYRANQGGSQPVAAFLCGGCVSLPYMKEFFAEKLQMPIEFFNPLRNVVVTQGVDVEQLSTKVHTLGEVTGATLRNLGNCPVELNLRPPSVIAAQEIAKRQGPLIGATACLLLALAAWGTYFWRANQIQSQALEQVNKEVTQLQTVADKFDALRKQTDELTASIAPLQLAIAEHTAWSAIIDELAAKLPARFIWVTELTPLSNGSPVSFGDGKPLTASGGSSGRSGRTQQRGPQAPGQEESTPSNAIDAIEIRGLYLENPRQAQVIDDFVNNLVGSSVFNVEEKEKEKLIRQRSTPDDETWAYAYTIVLPLRQPIPLQ